MPPIPSGLFQIAWESKWVSLQSQVLTLAQLFGDLRGRYCWRVRMGAGALLTLELGPPQLEIAEQRIDGVPHRSVTVRGLAQLVLHECAFRLWSSDGEVSERDELIALEQAARCLDGQALLEVADDEGTTRFSFDLGGVLEVTPLPELGPASIPWALSRVDSAVGRRADGALVNL